MATTSKLAMLLLAHVVTGALLEFPLLDSNDRPTEFKDGLPSYTKVQIDYGQGQPKELELFLLCTTCTISYIFGSPDDFTDMEKVGDDVDMVFKDGGLNVTIAFYRTTLTMNSINMEDNTETPYSWEMNMGYISPEFQSDQYFDNFKENMLGLAPFLTEDRDLLDRQFLATFAATQDIMESYAFNGGQTFAVGGNVTDYENLICSDGQDDGFDWANRGMLREGVIVEGTKDTNFAPPLVYYEGAALMEKVANYIPPIKQELESQALVIDTWNRETTLPGFYWRFFMETFMVPAYTCDKMESKDMSYPGFADTYSCYCNNGDYHTMPQINFEVTNENYQFDLDPSAYMFLPYINYTQPMSLCVLGLQESPGTLMDGTEYIGLGQRALATFPFYAVFDRVENRVAMELGNASDMNGAHEMGLQLASSAIIVLGLLILLGYLIYLRKSRIQAEEWLEQHEHILFSHAKNIKSEEDILQSLVDHAEGKERLEQRRDEKAHALQSKVGGTQGEATTALLGGESPHKRSPSASGRSKPEIKKTYTSDSELRDTDKETH